jgi:DNA processing protein
LKHLRYWLALVRAPELGSKRLRFLLAQPGAPASLFAEPVGVLRTLGLGEGIIAYLRDPDWKSVDRDLAWLDRAGQSCLTLEDPGYPPLLREIPTPPPVLFVMGDPAALSLRQIALVGSRNPTPLGESIAFDLSSALTSAGLAVTSGLAVGIDAAGHRGALAANGVTLAVVGTGLDQVYPRRHHALMEEIAASGAVVSEFPFETPPKAANFPRRNRIIGGLGLGTLVVEATLRSGSLITARLASEFGREVFAVPGSIRNPLARGCHALLKQGAKLVETVADVLEELTGFEAAWVVSPPHADPDDALDACSSRLLKYVAHEPTSVDTLVTATGYSAEQVASLLVLLELNGYVASTAAGCYCRIT